MCWVYSTDCLSFLDDHFILFFYVLCTAVHRIGWRTLTVPFLLFLLLLLLRCLAALMFCQSPRAHCCQTGGGEVLAVQSLLVWRDVGGASGCTHWRRPKVSFAPSSKDQAPHRGAVRCHKKGSWWIGWNIYIYLCRLRCLFVTEGCRSITSIQMYMVLARMLLHT